MLGNLGDVLAKFLNLSVQVTVPQITLTDLMRKGVLDLYLSDVGVHGNPPKTHQFWSRDKVQIDARTVLALLTDKLIDGKAFHNGLPQDVKLTPAGVDLAKKFLDGSVK